MNFSDKPTAQVKIRNMNSTQWNAEVWVEGKHVANLPHQGVSFNKPLKDYAQIHLTLPAEFDQRILFESLEL